MWFGKKKKPAVSKSYDRENFRPVVRCSICTGEKTAGFENKKTKQFTAERPIRSQQDLDEFLNLYGLTSVKEIY